MTTPVSSSATTTPAATASSSSSASAAGSMADSADRFLTLLVTQLKNQDPMNPLDNAQVTTQLAQISTVSGISKLNDTMTALAASFDAKQYLQAASLVGHDVVVDGNSLALADAKAQGAIKLDGDADKMTVTISDASGRAVRHLELGAGKQGVVSFQWDGKDDAGAAQKDGTYSISIDASASGKAVAASALAVGRVAGVTPGANGGGLTLDGLGKVDLASVLQIN